jgi:hypothetical protein
MNERVAGTLTVVVFVAVLLGVCGFVLSISGGARHAHRTDVALATSEHLAKLSESVADLRDAIGQTGVSGAGGAATGPRAPLQVDPGEIPVTWTDEPLPTSDAFAVVWNRTPPVNVVVQPQKETMPMLDNPTIAGVDVQALTNGRQIAWRVSWSDREPDYFLDTDRFCDAVALQFPLVANATYKMGDHDFPVYTVQWKAIWQKDIDEGFQDVQDLHPNYWTDLYWFAEGEFPYPVPAAFQRPEALDYFVAFRAGNPMADLYRRQPVQEMIAEGFGSLTHQPESVTVGGGQWRDGTWAVVFARPLETTDGSDYQFKPGSRDVVALAVWDGGAGNVGGRKHHSQWVVFQVQQ